VSLPDDFNQYPLPAVTVEFAVEDLFPGPKVKLAAGNGYDYLSPHHLSLVVRVSIVLAGSVVMVALRAGIEGSQLLQPAPIVLKQTRLVVIDEYARCNVHRVDQAESFPDAALSKSLTNLRCDVDESHPGSEVKLEHFSMAFHDVSIPVLETAPTTKKGAKPRGAAITLLEDAGQPRRSNPWARGAPACMKARGQL